jgi:uncharacterized phosphosugar-binding protein
MRTSLALCVAVSLALSMGCGKNEEKKEAMPNPADQYVTKVIACLDHTESILDSMRTPADVAAARWASGGHVYVTDDETIHRTGNEAVKALPGATKGVVYPMSEDWGGFVAEACDRAGGFRHIQPVPVDLKVTRKDVVLAGTVELHPDDQVAQLKKLKKTGALVILFGSKDSKAATEADFLIDNGLAAGIVPVMNAGNDSTLIGPVAPMANVINMWTFSAELIAAMNRLGKMPTLWESMFMPGADKRNSGIEKMAFDKKAKIEPVEPGVLGKQFIDAARSCLFEMKKNELDKLALAGKTCADAISSGHKVVASVVGHFMVAQTRMPGYPNLFTVKSNLYGRQYLEGVLQKGDVFLHVGYSYTPAEELAFAREVGAKTVMVFTPGPTKPNEGTPVAPDMSMIDVYIDPYWKHGDSVVEVPGYDVKVIPVSGVVMISSYWMIIGETVRAMAAGKS